MLVLLFNRDRNFLGEVFTAEGALRRLVLNDRGEQELGPSVKVWQTRGVPVRREIASHDPDGTRHLVFYMEYIAMRLPKFREALGMWATDHAVTSIDLPDDHVSYWETLLRLPLEPAEQFAFLLALRQTPTDLLFEWKTPLEEAALQVQQELEHTDKAVGVLKRRLEQRMLDPFKAKTVTSKKTVA